MRYPRWHRESTMYLDPHETPFDPQPASVPAPSAFILCPIPAGLNQTQQESLQALYQLALAQAQAALSLKHTSSSRYQPRWN